jgi:hypothetical protein
MWIENSHIKEAKKRVELHITIGIADLSSGPKT